MHNYVNKLHQKLFSEDVSVDKNCIYTHDDVIITVKNIAVWGAESGA